MDLNRTEEEQIEDLKKWWSENGKSVVGGIVIGLAAVFGWRGWQAHLIAETQAASEIYTGMVTEVRQKQGDKARELAEKLLGQYSSTNYATFAALVLAKLDIESGKLDSSINHLEWVLDNSNQEQLIQIARLRLARALLDNNQPDQAITVLENDKPGEFISSYEELKGDIYLFQGKYDEAQLAYQNALANSKNLANSDSYLQMKLEDIKQQKPR